MGNYSRWYDGFIYDTVISPMERSIHESILNIIKKGTTVIDVGCGVGTLSFQLASACKKVTGVDLSVRMIDFALRKNEKLRFSNLDFICENGRNLTEIFDQPRDYSVLSLCLHEMDSSARKPLAAACLEISDLLIISDYIPSSSPTVSTALRATVELIGGGPAHYRNFRNWQARGGTDGFITAMNLKIHKIIYWDNGIGLTALVSN